MGKSLGNGIYLADDEATVTQKVMSMYTDPNHIKVSDPGQVEGNVVFTYLDAFATDEQIRKYTPEYNNLDEIKEHYKRGGLGDVKVKRLLNSILNEVLTPIREKRAYYEQHKDEVYDMLFKGSDEARLEAQKTLAEVKRAMGINYREIIINITRFKANSIVSSNNFNIMLFCKRINHLHIFRIFTII